MSHLLTNLTNTIEQQIKPCHESLFQFITQKKLPFVQHRCFHNHFEIVGWNRGELHSVKGIYTYNLCSMHNFQERGWVVKFESRKMEEVVGQAQDQQSYSTVQKCPYQSAVGGGNWMMLVFYKSLWYIQSTLLMQTTDEGIRNSCSEMQIPAHMI